MGIRERVCACAQLVPAHTLVPRTVGICTHEDILSLWVFVCRRGSAHMGIFTQERDCTRWVLHTVGPARVEVCACALARRCESAHGGLFRQCSAHRRRPHPAPVRGLHTVGLAAGGSVAVRPVLLSTHPVPAPPRPGCPLPRPARQVRRLQRGVGRPAGQGDYSGRWRGARALRARPPGEGAAHKRRVCADAPPSARPPAARDWGRETPPGRPPAQTPPPPTPGAAADTAPGGHQREAGTAGRGRGSAASAGAPVRTSSAPRARTKGALERVGAPDVGKLEGQAPALRPLGDFSGSRTPASVSNYPVLSTEEAGTPACWVGRGVWGQGQRPSPPPECLAGGWGGGKAWSGFSRPSFLQSASAH